MENTAKSSLGLLLEGAGKILFGIAGMAFFIGGRAIHEIFGVNRAVSEMEGIGLAVVSAVLGMAAKTFGENFQERDGQYP